MSYVTYTTEAVVCGSFEQNTADKAFLLFTREAGMLFANARSVREEVSKQRFALQDFSRIRVSLIKGKTGWRIGSVESEKNDFSIAKTREARASVVSIYKLLRRFVRGEEASVDLYDFVVSALDQLEEGTDDRKFLDLFIQLKILSILGYVDQKSLPEYIFDHDLAKLSEIRDENLIDKMTKIITKAESSSHL
jgi:DNA repair protein RecO